MGKDIVENGKEKVFTRRLDFYWQSITVYSIILLIVSVLRGSIEEGTLSVRLADPLVILLATFIVSTSMTLLYNWYRRREIVIGKDYLLLRTRIGEKKYAIDDIMKINISKERNVKITNAARIARIKLKHRHRRLIISLNSYDNEKELCMALIELKRKLPKV